MTVLASCGNASSDLPTSDEEDLFPERVQICFGEAYVKNIDKNVVLDTVSSARINQVCDFDGDTLIYVASAVEAKCPPLFTNHGISETVRPVTIGELPLQCDMMVVGSEDDTMFKLIADNPAFENSRVDVRLTTAEQHRLDQSDLLRWRTFYGIPIVTAQISDRELKFKVVAEENRPWEICDHIKFVIERDHPNVRSIKCMTR